MTVSELIALLSNEELVDPDWDIAVVPANVPLLKAELAVGILVVSVDQIFPSNTETPTRVVLRGGSKP